MFLNLRQRSLHSAISLLSLMVLVFFAARLTGDPSVHYLPIDSTVEMRQEFAARHGLNDPLVNQFGRFLLQVAHFDLGESLRQARPALDIVLEAYPVTLLLAFLTMTISLGLAIVAGCISAWKPGGPLDRTITLTALAVANAPNFWIAIVGILVFSVWFHVLPTSGSGTPLHWVMPVAVLALRPWGLLTQVVRNGMIHALSSGYVKTARAKGATTARTLFIHALRNVMLPVVTVAGDQAVGIINGAVIVETVFSLPGIGKTIMDSITYRDFSVLQAAVLITAVAIFAANIAIDIVYMYIDPRVRAG